MLSEMEMQRALEERMKSLLEFANYQAVATRLGVSRTTVQRWAHGNAVHHDAVKRVLEVMRPDIPEQTEEAAPPEWARRLTDEVRQEIVAHEVRR